MSPSTTSLASVVEHAKSSLYFSAPVVADDLRTFQAQREACEAVGSTALAQAKRVVLVGSGGSLASLQVAAGIYEQLLDIPTQVIAAADVTERERRAMGPGTLLIASTYSGTTKDVLAAMRFAASRGAVVASLVGRPGTPAQTEADHSICYDSIAIYELPVVALIWMLHGLALDDAGRQLLTDISQSVDALPGILDKALAHEATVVESKARQFLPAKHLYVLGAGPLSPLAYKVALTVVMENIRIGGTYIDTYEFHHGPAEAMERNAFDMMFFIGTDTSREFALRTRQLCQDNGARVLTYDAADHDGLHPLLASLVTNSLVQWFVVYSAALRGITDMDQHNFMGHALPALAD
ncbi:SIS domain-containing protein [Streptomyces sp. NPDC001083]|uniref:SIS domain-containing protein n=1 Tax=Streptomyces sp. NPDC001083 TaxID=3364545 RepID=UPI0036C66BDE